MRVRVADESDRKPFNDFVAASPYADVLQSWEWGEVKRESGWEPARLIVEDDGQVQGTCSVLLKRPAAFMPPIAYAPRGPVLDFARSDVLDHLIQGVVEHAGAGLVFSCDPPIEQGSSAADALLTRMRAVRVGGFGGVQPKAVMVLDLRPDPDSLLGSMKSKWRYNIRLSQRKGVTVREGGEADLPEVYRLLEVTARRDRFVIRGRPYFETLWKVLAPAGMLKLFIAEYEESALSAVLLFLMGSRAIYVYGASSDEHRNLMANHLIQWHAITWSRNHGFSIYDFQGVPPAGSHSVSGNRLAGLQRFKEGFGARYVEYQGQLDLPLRAAWYGFWKLAGPAVMLAGRRLKRIT